MLMALLLMMIIMVVNSAYFSICRRFQVQRYLISFWDSILFSSHLVCVPLHFIYTNNHPFQCGQWQFLKGFELVVLLSPLLMFSFNGCVCQRWVVGRTIFSTRHLGSLSEEVSGSWILILYMSTHIETEMLSTPLKRLSKVMWDGRYSMARFGRWML